MKKIFLDKIGSVTLIEKYIIHIDILPEVDLDVPEIKLLHEAVLKVSKGEKYAILSTSGFACTITPAAREYSATQPTMKEFRIAKALVVSNLAHSLVGNFYIKFNKPFNPTKMFRSKSEALNWLRDRVKEYSMKIEQEAVQFAS
jgi:hypothetical protein